jgi:hypothetical protein
MHGFLLLGERSRFLFERETVRDVLLKHVDIDSYDCSDTALFRSGTVTASYNHCGVVCVEFGHEMSCLCILKRA